MSNIENNDLTTPNIIRSKIKKFLKQYPAKIRTLANVFYYFCNIIQKDPDYSRYLLNLIDSMYKSFKPIGKQNTKNELLYESLFHDLYTAILVLTFPAVNRSEIEEIKKYFYELGLEDSLEGFLRAEYNLGFENRHIEELPISNMVHMQTAAKSVEHFALPGNYDIATMQEKLHKYYDTKKMNIEFPTTKFSGPLSFNIVDLNGNKVGYVHVSHSKIVTFFTVTE